MYLRDEETDYMVSDPIFRSLFMSPINQTRNFKAPNEKLFNTDIAKLRETVIKVKKSKSRLGVYD